MKLSKKAISEGLIVGIIIAVITAFFITPIHDWIWPPASAAGSNNTKPDSAAQHLQHIKDSIAQVKEKETDAANAKEITEKRLIDADRLINNYINSLSVEIDEYTHEQEGYTIDTAKITYNKYTKLVTIPFTGYWKGVVHYTTENNPLEWHQLTGELLYYADGTYQIKPLTLNDALATDIRETKSLQDGLDKVEKISKLFSGDNQGGDGN